MFNRLAAAGVLAASLVLLAAGTAIAGPSTPFSAHWDVPATCPFSATVSSVDLTGNERDSSDAHGGVHVTVKGRAVDNLGNSYTFNYHNNLRVDSAGDVMITDHFNLVGDGPAAKVHAGFNLRITAAGDVFFNEHGGSLTLGCDPI